MKKIIKITENQLKFLTKNILNEKFKQFKTKETSYDPESSSISWDVEYETNLDSIFKDIKNIEIKLEKLVMENDNEKTRNLLKFSRSLSNRFARFRKRY